VADGSFGVCAPQDDRERLHVQYWVYLLTNRWKTVLYTGVTNELQRRIAEHKRHEVDGFTKQYNCDRLVYFEVFERIEQAIAREKQIKGWIRAKKNALIATTNPEWNDLTAQWQTGPSLRSG